MATAPLAQHPARPWALLVALFAILLWAPAAQGASAWHVATLHKDRPAWEGFGVGTMVHYRVTTTRRTEGDSDESQSTEVKEALAKITDRAFEISKQHKTSVGWSPATTKKIERSRSAAKRTVTPLGTEKVRVGENDYSCRKLSVTTTRTGPEGEESSESATLWEHAEHGVLKSEFRRAGTMTIIVTKLLVRRRVGTRELLCREFRIDGGQQSGTTLLCPDVPGRLVESRWKFESGGSRRIDKVLVAFEKK